MFWNITCGHIQHYQYYNADITKHKRGKFSAMILGSLCKWWFLPSFNRSLSLHLTGHKQTMFCRVFPILFQFFFCFSFYFHSLSTISNTNDTMWWACVNYIDGTLLLSSDVSLYFSFAHIFLENLFLSLSMLKTVLHTVLFE